MNNVRFTRNGEPSIYRVMGSVPRVGDTLCTGDQGVITATYIVAGVVWVMDSDETYGVSITLEKQ